MQYINDSGCKISNFTINRSYIAGGDSVSISFKLSLTSTASKGSINAPFIMLYANVTNSNTGEPVSLFAALWQESSNIIIPRGGSRTLTKTFVFPEYTGTSEASIGGFTVEAHSSDGGLYAPQVTSAYTWLNYRENPVITSAVWSDRNALNPLAYFGGFLAGESMPLFVGTATIDTRDPTLTVTHKLDVSIASDAVYSQENATGTFELPAFSANGSASWKYTVADSAGNSAQQTGTFAVFGYHRPVITNFKAERYETVTDDQGNVSYVASDDGTSVRIAFAGDVAAVNSQNAWSLVIKYCEANSTSYTSVTAQTGTDGQSITLTDDRSVLTAVFSASTSYEITAVLTDWVGTVTRIDGVIKAGAYFNVEKTGVAVGQRSTGTALEPLFECAYPAYFYAGISGIPKVQSGREAATYGTANTEQTVTFPEAFSEPPNVTITVDSNGVGWGAAIGVFVKSVTASGFAFRKIATPTAREGYIQWIAVGT